MDDSMGKLTAHLRLTKHAATIPLPVHLPGVVLALPLHILFHYTGKSRYSANSNFS